MARRTSSGRLRHGRLSGKPRAWAMVRICRHRNERRPLLDAGHGPGREGAVGVQDDLLRVDLLDHAEAGALRAGALGRVEREEPRRDLGEGEAAVRAGVRGESTNSSPSARAMRTSPSPILRAVSSESTRRLPRSARTARRSTTTSMVCLRFLSSSGGVAASTISPLTRARTKPSLTICSKSLRCSPFLPAVSGARTMKRVPSGMARMRSTICWTVWPWIGRSQSGHYGTPIEAYSSRR